MEQDGSYERIQQMNEVYRICRYVEGKNDMKKIIFSLNPMLRDIVQKELERNQRLIRIP